MEVYAVIYDHYNEEGIPFTDLLGIFSTRPKAFSALEENGFTPDNVWKGCWVRWVRGTAEYAYIFQKTMNQLTEEILDGPQVKGL